MLKYGFLFTTESLDTSAGFIVFEESRVTPSQIQLQVF